MKSQSTGLRWEGLKVNSLYGPGMDRPTEAGSVRRLHHRIDRDRRDFPAKDNHPRFVPALSLHSVRRLWDPTRYARIARSSDRYQARQNSSTQARKKGRPPAFGHANLSSETLALYRDCPSYRAGSGAARSGAVTIESFEVSRGRGGWGGLPMYFQCCWAAD